MRQNICALARCASVTILLGFCIALNSGLEHGGDDSLRFAALVKAASAPAEPGERTIWTPFLDPIWGPTWAKSGWAATPQQQPAAGAPQQAPAQPAFTSSQAAAGGRAGCSAVGGQGPPGLACSATGGGVQQNPQTQTCSAVNSNDPGTGLCSSGGAGAMTAKTCSAINGNSDSGPSCSAGGTGAGGGPPSIGKVCTAFQGPIGGFPECSTSGTGAGGTGKHMSCSVGNTPANQGNLCTAESFFGPARSVTFCSASAAPAGGLGNKCSAISGYPAGIVSPGLQICSVFGVGGTGATCSVRKGVANASCTSYAGANSPGPANSQCSAGNAPGVVLCSTIDPAVGGVNQGPQQGRCGNHVPH